LTCVFRLWKEGTSEGRIGTGHKHSPRTEQTAKDVL